MKMQVIDFSKLGGPVYVGRANGAQARVRLRVDSLDAQKGPVEIRVPDDAYAVSSSFFLGLFGPSLAHYETPEAFLAHYPISAPDHIRDTLRMVIDRALSSRGQLAL